jgi:ribosomal protein S18 acetylase RimI-like enzyme
MDNLSVRRAELKDANGIARVHVETWQCAYKGQIPDHYLQSLSIDKREKKWREILSNSEKNTQTYVAELDGKVAGFCSVGCCRDKDMGPEVGELWGIYVDKDSMAKGVGSVLLKEGLDYLRKHRYTKATLWVLSSNQQAREWYEPKKWKIEGKTQIDSSRGFDLHETRYIIDL